MSYITKEQIENIIAFSHNGNFKALKNIVDPLLNQPDAEPATTWRCYHCNEVCTDRESAGEHFGRNEYSEPICKIDAARYREMEEQIRRANEEDSETDRKMYALQAKHRSELRSEEERGYARGLHDAKAHPPAPKAITASDVTDGMVVAWSRQINAANTRKDEISAAVNAFNGVKP